MGHAVGQILSHAVGVTISPLTLIAMILILTAPGGRSNAFAFAVGWIVAVSGIFTVLMALSIITGAEHNGHPGTWVAWFRLIVGLLLALMTFRQVRMLGNANEGTLPKRFQNIEQFNIGNSLALGAMLVVANPKNVTQIAAGAVTTASATAHPGGRISAALIFVAIASLGVLVPAAVHFARREASWDILNRWEDWTVRHHYAIMAVLFALLSAKSLGDGISGLT
ncbi:GAP family protein [Nocardia sp. SYP-A9097]|uniref:GAP family protein n=1 Tax=Nocardia sp. SYP-A9097 TaxID=2663237 RepID=UPI00129A310C|nr:GAP family protein [Nocardia sp. SYP-A9097]MRH87529.1 GAP family protein [Nocardia sp. SYP-A9097]